MCVKHLTPPLARIYDHVVQVISLLTYENIIDYTIISNNFVRLKKGIFVGCKSYPTKYFRSRTPGYAYVCITIAIFIQNFSSYN